MWRKWEVWGSQNFSQVQKCKFATDTLISHIGWDEPPGTWLYENRELVLKQLFRIVGQAKHNTFILLSELCMFGARVELLRKTK